MKRKPLNNWRRRGSLWAADTKAYGQILKRTAVEWWNDNTFRLAASLAFYTIFSLAPILLISVGVAGWVFGEEAAARQIVAQVNQLVGPEGGRAIQEVLRSAADSGKSPLAVMLGVITVIIGSTAVFAELQSALNHVWGVSVDLDRNLLVRFILDRLLSFTMVLGVGFMLLVSLIMSALLAGAQEFFTQWTPTMPWLWRLLNFAVSFLYITVLFMMIYKFLPDVRNTWHDVAVGAVVTAILFSIGKFAIGAYLGRMSIGSTYGAAGSFVVLLVWIYYSALISFFGAEFTQVYTRMYGSTLRPEDFSTPTGEKSPSIQP